MERKQIWEDFEELPTEAQRQVVDFIAFLKSRYQIKSMLDKPKPKLADDGFIGMWQDREDMQDSTKWVRSLRSSEW